MKNIILIIAVAFSGVCYGQSETELDSASMALINEAVTELETWKKSWCYKQILMSDLLP